jgi:hypothetical protein
MSQMHKTYRNQKLRVISWLAGVGLGGLFVLLAVAPTSRDADAFSRTVSFFLAAVWLLMYWRLAEMSVHVDDTGLTIRNFNRTLRIRWSEVREFRLPKGANSAKVELFDGRTISLHGIQPARATWIFKRRSFAANHVDELNELLEERRRA